MTPEEKVQLDTIRKTQEERDYWQQRCEAAEEVIGDLRMDRDPIEAGTKWNELVKQQP